VKHSKIPVLALLFAGLTTPALAETDCTSEWVLISQMMNTQGDAVSGEGAQCMVSNVKWADGTQASSLHWSVPDFIQAALEGRMPQSVQVNIMGLIETSPTADMGALAGKPADMEISYAWDATSRVMDLSGVSVAFADGQGIFLQGQIAGLDLSSAQMMQISAMQAALTDLDVKISGSDVLSLMLNPALDELADGPGSTLAAPTQSELQAANEFVDQLPQASFNLGTRQALKSLVVALPNAQDGIRLTLKSEIGLSAMRMMPILMQDDPAMVDILRILFDGAIVDVTYPWVAE